MSSNVSIDEAEEDQDSLFGSPPPSPRGRSPSPALALPSTSSAGAMCSVLFAQQNVGTIALPGSHLYSELPVNPLASSSSPLQTLRPPAQGVAASATSLTGFQVQSCTPSESRSSSTAPLNKKRKTIKSKESTPRPPGPEIELPDPSAPVPAHFLRNQTALLGTAGLVGGVKPSSLSIQRGTTSQNPIIVEEEDDAPTIGRKSKFRHPYRYPIDPSLLPAPTNQEIVAMLIGQKDIFPVIENLLKLIAVDPQLQQKVSFRTPTSKPQEQPSPSSSGTTQRQLFTAKPTPPPTKKRKLNSVPAGATDWDVPYPFAQGEGPDSYHTTWERQRKKQLISQLVNLIKTAARKAATKNYLMNEERSRREREEAAKADSETVLVEGYYRHMTATYGSEGTGTKTVNEMVRQADMDGEEDIRQQLQQTTSQWPAKGGSFTTIAHSAEPPVLVNPQPSTPFDQLISSLLAASPEQGLPSRDLGMRSGIALMGTFSIASASTGTSTPVTSSSGGSEGVDQALFDSWMSVLQTFPVPSEGFSQAQADSANTPSSVLPPDDFGEFHNPFFDLNMVMAAATLNSSVPDMSDFDSLFAQMPMADHAMDVDSSAVHVPLNIGIDHLIDPTLLAISVPQPLPASTNASSNVGHHSSIPPSLAPSPNPSASSHNGQGPLTPNMESWDMSLPDIFVPMTEGVEGFGRFERGARGVQSAGSEDDVLPESISTGKGVDKGKRRADVDLVETEEVLLPNQQALDQQALWRSLMGSNSTLPEGSVPLQLPPPGTGAAPVSLSGSKLQKVQRKSNREMILRKAQDRKRSLEDELKRVKVQLWETTIEQGVLSHLMKHYNGTDHLS